LATLKKYRQQKGDIQKVTYWGHTNIRRQPLKLSYSDDMAPGICATLTYILW